MKTTVGAISTTGSGNGTSHDMNPSSPDTRALVGVSGAYTSGTLVVEGKLFGGSIWYPLAMVDRKTGTKYNGSAALADATTTSFDVNAAGMQSVRAYFSGGSAITAVTEIVSGTVAEFGSQASGVTVNNSALTTFGAGIALNGATGTNVITISDNLADALSISEGANAYLTFTTTDSGETITVKKKLTFADAIDIAFNATTGTKIGTATTQKLSLYGKTPVVQPVANTDTTTGAAGGTNSVYLNTTFTGGGTAAYTIGGMCAALKAIGALAV